MSYCRWSSPIRELAGETDISFQKQVALLKSGKNWNKYLESNNVPLSDVYIYESCYGGYTCHIKGGRTFSTETSSKMAEALVELKDNGTLISQSVITELQKE